MPDYEKNPTEPKRTEDDSAIKNLPEKEATPQEADEVKGGFGEGQRLDADE